VLLSPCPSRRNIGARRWGKSKPSISDKGRSTRGGWGTAGHTNKRELGNVREEAMLCKPRKPPSASENQPRSSLGVHYRICWCVRPIHLVVPKSQTTALAQPRARSAQGAPTTLPKSSLSSMRRARTARHGRGIEEERTSTSVCTAQRNQPLPTTERSTHLHDVVQRIQVVGPQPADCQDGKELSETRAIAWGVEIPRETRAIPISSMKRAWTTRILSMAVRLGRHVNVLPATDTTPEDDSENTTRWKK